MHIELAPVEQPPQLCAAGWETPGPTVHGIMSVHLCRLEPDHDGGHLCYCGAEREPR